MRKLLLLVAILIQFSSCKSKTLSREYLCQANISDNNGQAYDSLTPYFPFQILLPSVNRTSEVDSFILSEYSCALYAVKEPVLYNCFLDYPRYRFLWIRAFHFPVIITLHNQAGKVWIDSKQLDRQTRCFTLIHKDVIPFKNSTQDQDVDTASYQGSSSGDSIIPTVRTANSMLHQNRVLSQKEWENFENMLAQCGFWQMSPLEDTGPGVDGANWIIEAHLANKYWFTDRWSPENKYKKCGEYLIKLSQLKVEKY